MNHEQSAMRPVISPVRVATGPEMLAEQIRERILSGQIAPGAALPAERELVVQSGLSRATVREALRIVEAQGLVQTRSGRNGGTWVCQPDHNLMSLQLSTFIRGRSISQECVFDAREAIEIVTSSLAARNRTEDDLAAIRREMVSLEDPSTPPGKLIEGNIAWHLAVARASHNELLTDFMYCISSVIAQHLQGEEARELRDEGSRVSMCRAHRSICKAIEARDPEAAARRMSRHLQGSREKSRNLGST
jgi:DNA-binding FadR family transcriptional regulator